MTYLFSSGLTGMHTFPPSLSLLPYFAPFVSNLFFFLLYLLYFIYFIYLRLLIFSPSLSHSPSFSPLHLSTSKWCCSFCLMMFHGLISLFWLFVLSHYVCVKSHTIAVLFLYRMLSHAFSCNSCIMFVYKTLSFLNKNKQKKKNVQFICVQSMLAAV